MVTEQTNNSTNSFINKKVTINKHRNEFETRLYTAVLLLCFVVLLLFFASSSINLFGFNGFNLIEQRGFGFTFLFLGIIVLSLAVYEIIHAMIRNKKQWYLYVIFWLIVCFFAYAPTFLYWLQYMRFYHLSYFNLCSDFGYIQLMMYMIFTFSFVFIRFIIWRHEIWKTLLSNYLGLLLITYFFIFFNFIVLLHSWTALLIIWIPVAFNDTFAYIGGKTYGKHKMSPKVSPKKTWEGTLTGVISTIIAILIIGAFYLLDKNQCTNDYGFIVLNNNITGNMFAATPVINTPYSHLYVYFLVLLCFGVVIAILGTYGDLLFSWFKRNYKIKDFSKLLPGHGGILDRIDSLILIVIFFGVYDLISADANPNLYPLFPYLQ